MSLSLLRASLQDDARALAQSFAVNRPFRHVVIDNFLEPNFCEALGQQFPPFASRHATNETGQVGGKAAVAEIARLGPAYQRLDQLLREESFRSFIGTISGIAHLLYDPDYVGGGTHENLTGQALDIHIDFNYHPRTHWHRRLNLILFLNRTWAEDWGGVLELHRNPWGPVEEDEVAQVLPVWNRCVIFETTEHSWHGFPKIHLPPDAAVPSRRSIAVYHYTAERPAEQLAASHGTVYVPERVPSYVEAGQVLSAEQAHELRVLFQRRDDQIRFLYERELETNEVLHGVLRSPSFRMGRALTLPLRWLRGGR
ncbi:MAG: 2OG-Fe(II) oxygenase [Bryobacter sp.]|nr:2OG-Fe(II) oxygenase [Bryobacter sp.]